MSTQSGFVGAIPAQDFLDKFVSPGHDIPPAPSVNFARVFYSKSDAEASEAFIRSVEDAHACPGLRFYLARLKRRQAESMEAIEDAAEDDTDDIYVPPYPSIAARASPKAATKCPRKNLSEFYNFSTAVLMVEFAVDRDADPFMEPEDYGFADTPSPPPETSGVQGVSPPGSSADLVPFERDTPEADVVRERLLKSAQALFLRQHRHSLYQLLFVHGGVRFLRFDRSGSVVTQRLDYARNPEPLAAFLWRFSHMDDGMRGQDPSTTLATRQEASLFTDAVHDFLDALGNADGSQKLPRTLPHAEHSLDSSETFPIWKIRVTSNNTGQSTSLVVQRPFAGSVSLRGRATRAYLAYDLPTRRLVFFKDSWRAKNSHRRSEFDIYCDLRANGVPFVPEILFGGDVLDAGGDPRQTVADELAVEDATWRRTDDLIHGHVHHRLVQDIFYPLDSVHNERELLQSLHDAILAIDKAHQALGIIHRDLTNSNVMLDSRGKCVLNDWDHAGPPDPDAGAIGTVQFMSTRLLRSMPHKPAHHELVDDLQSIFWLLNYVAIVRFALHHDNLKQGLFVARAGREGNMAAGADKLASLYDVALYAGRYRSAALTELIRDLAQCWTDYEYLLSLPASWVISDHLDIKRDMLELAAQPEFWRQKFAEALRKYDEEQEAAHGADAPEGQDEADALDATPVVRAGSKRRASEDARADDGRQLVRRSKRLRVMRQRKE